MPDMIPFIDLKAQRARLKSEMDRMIDKVLDEGRYILGPEVSELEEKLSEFNGVGRALSCANGTDAILIPLMAWGVGPGDAVFVPSFTFAASAEVVVLAGATPVFVDVDPDTYNISVESLAAAIDATISGGELTPKAVIAVDLFGQPADYPRISELAKAHDLKLISDCAQGFGSTLNGRSALHWADVLTVSFYPAKPLGGYGDGGAVLCKDDALYAAMKSVRVHGEGADRYEYARIGLNSRLDTLQAAVLLSKLTIFAEEIQLRQKVADAYEAGFAQYVKKPKVISGAQSTWAQYTIEVEDRDGFRAQLSAAGVPTAVYYPIPLHLHEPYAGFPISPGGLPVTEEIAHRVVSLPMHPYLDGDQIGRIVAAVRSAT
ncbi:MAG: DegT/DnrJ/EryC1/StrS aminotransferase family protein [Maricaulis sp.]|uniref:DegT/DnrJ/EryC1/StrS family aminotransferase n=1 Tax=Maricaulis sp. TaxID=1486257 RepID=UPI00260C033E|nr:DegT/DnrJ/EryC1/StrS aminotransferase family protein [Maricaulis sp.]MDM7984929.1 DegT/DnrJ/EryC1/StrS aminotransferase family protein [Maricaulis sp.]